MKKVALILALGITGCASSPDKIETSYVSPMQYKSYDCDQIMTELSRVNRRAGELQVSLKTKADNDSLQMATGMLLFWPALFFLEGGDGPDAAEYARLKGEREALEQASTQRKCETPPEQQAAAE